MVQQSLLTPLAFIERKHGERIIHQRAQDGYINATAMCKAADKLFADYRRLQATQEFLSELSSVMGIPITELIQVFQGGIPDQQATWVHPQIAINLGQWCSPVFAVKVSQWVTEWMSGSSAFKNRMPYHLRRYVANMTQIPYGNFAILQELTYGLIAPLEAKGYRLPDNLLPDISEGRMFADWLRKEKGMDLSQFPKYTHAYEDGRKVRARLYPNSLLADFRAHFYDVWLPKKAMGYFNKRDKIAIPYLGEMLLEIEQQKQEAVEHKRGRPAKQIIPPIKDTPERVAQAIMLPVDDNAF